MEKADTHKLEYSREAAVDRVIEPLIARRSNLIARSLVLPAFLQASRRALKRKIKSNRRSGGAPRAQTVTQKTQNVTREKGRRSPHRLISHPAFAFETAPAFGRSQPSDAYDMLNCTLYCHRHCSVHFNLIDQTGSAGYSPTAHPGGAERRRRSSSPFDSTPLHHRSLSSTVSNS